MAKDIKDIWKLESSRVPLEDKSVDKMLQQDSTHMLDRIIKTLKKEHKLNFVIYPIIFVALLYFQLYVEAGLCLIIFVSTVYYYNKLLSELRINSIALSTYEYLKHSYRILKKFMNHYKISGAVLTIAGFTVGLLYSGGWDKLYNKFDQASVKELWLAITYIALGLMVSVGIFFKLIDLVYIKKMKSLKLLINDLEENL